MKEQDIDFATVRVGKLFGKLFIPTLLGMLGMSAMTAIDGVFIGHCVGSDGIAAVNIIVPLIMLLTGVSLMIGTGSSVTASVLLARGCPKLARLHVTQAMAFASLVAVAFMAPLLLFPDEAARLLGASEHLVPMVREYMVWYVPSWLFLVWTGVALFAIRLDGAPRTAMTCSLVAAVMNIVLDWLFMFPLGWGLMGGALATSLSTASGGLIAVAYLLRHAGRLRLHPLKMSRKSMRFAVRNIGVQCRIGSSALLGEATLAVLMLTGNLVFMHYLGDDGVGAFGLVCYYMPFIFMVGNAIAQSAQPIISYNFGLGLAQRTRAAEQVALLTATACGVTVSLVFMLLPEQLTALFLDPRSPAARLAVQGFPLFATGFLFFVLNITAVGYFQSVERLRPATTFALMRGLVVLVPSFVVLPRLLGEPGIWLAMPLAEGVTALAVAAFFVAGRMRASRRPAQR